MTALRWLGSALMIAGVVAIVVAVVGLASSGGGEAAAATSTTSTTSAPTTTVALPTTTTASATTTSTSSPTAAPTTTTSTVAAETVEEFVAAFATALAAGDVEFVWSRLHPEVVAGYGEGLCRAWVEREIMALTDYTLVSIDGGPSTASFDLPQGSVTVTGVFDATVRFTFQGAETTTATDYALVGAEMHWLGQCR